MYVISARNVHNALPEGIRLLDEEGIKSSSRNGDVLVHPTPVMTIYEHPWERVLFWPQRDANPFFHLMEACWMLAGEDDVDWIAYYNSRMRQFSDDDMTLHGAYGYRWRYHFNKDQLDTVIELLRKSPRSRRAVISMWDANEDLNSDETASKDQPCNTHAYVQINHDGHLDLTILCRSNDIVWGAYGANPVHFSYLLEYLAEQIGVGCGRLYQFSNNYHAYLQIFDKVRDLKLMARDPFRAAYFSPYELNKVYVYPLGASSPGFKYELNQFIHGLEGDVFEILFFKIMTKISRAYRYWKEDKDYVSAYQSLEEIPDRSDGAKLDWKLACIEWLRRREQKQKAKETDNL